MSALWRWVIEGYAFVLTREGLASPLAVEVERQGFSKVDGIWTVNQAATGELLQRLAAGFSTAEQDDPPSAPFEVLVLPNASVAVRRPNGVVRMESNWSLPTVRKDERFRKYVLEHIASLDRLIDDSSRTDQGDKLRTAFEGAEYMATVSHVICELCDEARDETSISIIAEGITALLPWHLLPVSTKDASTLGISTALSVRHAHIPLVQPGVSSGEGRQTNPVALCIRPSSEKSSHLADHEAVVDHLRDRCGFTVPDVHSVPHLYGLFELFDEYQPALVHYTGHAALCDRLQLGADEAYFTSDDLADSLNAGKIRHVPSLVYLNCCQTVGAQNSIATQWLRASSAVIASRAQLLMQADDANLHDRAEFAKAFYSAWASGASAAAAMRLARLWDIEQGRTTWTCLELWGDGAATATDTSAGA